jgi:hypothetical protein
MNLLEVRTQFVKVSGRYDLVTDAISFADNGADFYINSGQRFLDKAVTVPENTATIFLPLGEYALTFQYGIRSIQRVFVNSSTSRFQLPKKDLSELKNSFAEPVNLITTGGPTCYALADLRALETTDKNSLGEFINLTHDETDLKYDYRGIIIAPPVDEAYVVEISGLFEQFVLSNDTDENWWTIREPDMLIKAALYQLEISSRGTENARNFLSSLTSEITLLEKDFVEEEVSDIDNMKG